MFVASSSDSLNLFKLCTWVPKMAGHGAHMFYLDLYKEKLRFCSLLILST